MAWVLHIHLLSVISTMGRRIYIVHNLLLENNKVTNLSVSTEMTSPKAHITKIGVLLKKKLVLAQP